MIAIRRTIHRHPELAFEEEKTRDLVAGQLRSLGLTPRSAAGTGLVADLEGGRSGAGPTIALRADMDALPIDEQTDLPFASQIPGRMHACGHDAHTAILLGAAERLVSRQSEICGRVRFIFQPAEEITEGAAAMIEDGALHGVDAIFGLHNAPQLEAGLIEAAEGPILAAADQFVLEITGRGGHAAMPHLAADPIVAAAAVVMSLQSVVSRAVNPLSPVALSVCSLTAGNSHNVIPDRARLKGTARTLDPEVREALPGLIENCADNIAAGHRCAAKLDYRKMVPVVSNGRKAVEIVRQAALRAVGAERVGVQRPIMASEDFAFYLAHVPGCFFSLGSGSPHGVHHPGFNLDEACLEPGADVMTEVAIEALREWANR